MKGMTKGSPVNEEVPPLLQGDGKIEVCLTGFVVCYDLHLKGYNGYGIIY